MKVAEHRVQKKCRQLLRNDRPPIIFAFSNDRDFDTSPVDDICAVRFTHYTNNFLVHAPHIAK
jgi:hypothetical protein